MEGNGSCSHHGIKKVPCFNATEQGTAVNPFQGIAECISNTLPLSACKITTIVIRSFSPSEATIPGSIHSGCADVYCSHFGFKKCPHVASLLFGKLDFDHFSVCSCWDSDVVRLLGSVSVGDAGTLPLESVISRVRRSLANFSHFVTRNLPTASTVTSPW